MIAFHQASLFGVSFVLSQCSFRSLRNLSIHSILGLPRGIFRPYPLLLSRLQHSCRLFSSYVHHTNKYVSNSAWGGQTIAAKPIPQPVPILEKRGGLAQNQIRGLLKEELRYSRHIPDKCGGAPRMSSVTHLQPRKHHAMVTGRLRQRSQDKRLHNLRSTDNINMMVGNEKEPLE